jgi:hypothetical protein
MRSSVILSVNYNLLIANDLKDNLEIPSKITLISNKVVVKIQNLTKCLLIYFYWMKLTFITFVTSKWMNVKFYIILILIWVLKHISQ